MSVGIAIEVYVGQQGGYSVDMVSWLLGQRHDNTALQTESEISSLY